MNGWGTSGNGFGTPASNPPQAGSGWGQGSDGWGTSGTGSGGGSGGGWPDSGSGDGWRPDAGNSGGGGWPGGGTGGGGWPGNEPGGSGGGGSTGWVGDSTTTTVSPGPDAGSSASASAPILWLIAGIVVALAATVLGFFWRELTGGIIGWVLAGPVAIGLLCLFALLDNKARQNPWYGEGALDAWLRRALVVMALVGIAVNAWTIADVVARA